MHRERACAGVCFIHAMENLLQFLPKQPQPAAIRYGVTAVLVLAFFIFRISAAVAVGQYGFIFFIPPILAASILYDRGSGVVGTILATLLVGLTLLCLMILAPFITPIVWAAILAYASWPLYRRLRRMLHGHGTIAALLMTLILGCAVVLPVLWILVLVQGELITAYQALTRYLAQGPHTAPNFLARVPWVGQKIQDTMNQYAADPAELTQQLSAWLLSWASQLGHILSSVGRNVVKLTLTLLTLFFFYRDGETIATQADQVIEGFFADRLNPYVVTAGKMTRAVVYGLLITAINRQRFSPRRLTGKN